MVVDEEGTGDDGVFDEADTLFHFFRKKFPFESLCCKRRVVPGQVVVELLAGARAIGGTNGLFLLRVVCAVVADGEREARKAGDDCWLIEGCTMVVNGDTDDGRSCWLRWWRRLGRRRRVDLHGDERFFT